MTDEVSLDRGFTLMTVLLMILLVMSLSVYLCLLVANESALTGCLDSQLYGLILAENGLEYARTLLPHLDLDQMLKGPDGQHSGTGTREWRNPLPFDVARKLDLACWSVQCDDGWPADSGTLLLPGGYAARGGGRFYIRFSNNPEEPATDDQDGVVLVRSMGVTRSSRHGLFGALRNDVTLVEAVMRQETVFNLQAALVLFGASGEFTWQSDGFEFNGGTNPAVAGVGPPELTTSFIHSLGAGDIARFKGAGHTPSVRDTTGAYMTSPVHRRVFDTRFWDHLQQRLPAFTDTRLPGLQFYPGGGEISGRFEGFLVARGDLTLTAASVEGLILHLGGGRLTLGSDLVVRGAIWMSNNNSNADGSMVHQPLNLTVLDSVSIVYDAGVVRRSLTLVPPTQLGWRILFPEMKL